MQAVQLPVDALQIIAAGLVYFYKYCAAALRRKAACLSRSELNLVLFGHAQRGTVPDDAGAGTGLILGFLAGRITIIPQRVDEHCCQTGDREQS